jgi:hypothetical protein
MKVQAKKNGMRSIVFLSRRDKDVLIYMTSDVWITPELKRFKNEILERVNGSI